MQKMSTAAAGYQLSSSVWEIEEEEVSGELLEINHAKDNNIEVKEDQVESSSLFSLDVRSWGEDSVYVAVGKSDSSKDALSWTLRNYVNPSTMLYLVHVFPEIRHIPSPLGLLPKNHVSAGQVESYMAQEREKRRQLLQKFLDACSASNVKVDTVLIESDAVAKAILDLIPILNIRKLVIGTTKSSLRKLKSRKGSGIADQIFQNSPDTCEIKIVCEGKEVVDQPSPLRSDNNSNSNKPSPPPQDNTDPRPDSFSCMCFKAPKF